MDLMSLLVKFGVDTSNLEKGLQSVGEIMRKTDKESSTVGSKISKAFKLAGVGIGVAVGAIAGATAAVTKLTTAAAATTDRIDKMSQKIGVSRSTFQELDFIMSQSGGSVESLQMGMKTLRSAMNGADGGNKDLQASFSRLGIAVKNADGTFRDQETVMFEALEKLQGVTDETERAALAQQLFGKSAIELTPLLNSGAGSIEAMRKQAHELGLVLDDDAIDAGVHLTDTIDQVKRAFDSVKTKIGVTLMPVVQRILDVVLENMPLIQNVLGGVFGVLGKVVSGAVTLIGWVAKPITKLAGFLVNTFGGKVTGALNNLKTTFTDAFGGIAKTLSNLKLVKVIKDIFDRITSLIKKYGSHLKLHQILAAIFTGGRVELGTGTSFVHFFKSVFQNSIAKALLDLFNGDGTFLHSIMQPIINALGTLDDLFLTIKQQFQPVIDAFKTLGSVIGGLFTGQNSLADLKEAFKGVWESIVNIDWGLIWNKIKSVFESWKTLLTETIDWKALGGAIWQKIKDGIKATGDWLKETLGYSPSDDWLTIGKDLWVKIKTGIKNAVKGASDWLKTALGYSPSDDWMTIGGDLWGKITAGITELVNGDWLKTLLGYSPSDDWGTVGGDLWGKITGGITSAVGEVSDWLKGLVGFTPDTSWSEIGGQIWGTIKAGITTVGDWIKALVIGDNYTPETSWSEVGSKIWGKITEGLSGAVEWLKGILTDWTEKLTSTDVDFTSVGSSIATAIFTGISTIISGIAAWFKAIFGSDEKGSVKSEVGGIDWAGLGSSIFGLIIGAFSTIGETLKGLFVTAWDSINNLNWAGLGRNMWKAIKKAFGSVKQWFVDTFKAPINAVIGLINSMLTAVESAVNSMITAINDKLHLHSDGFWVGWPINQQVAAYDWSPNIPTVQIGQIPLLANGGTVLPGNAAIVGDAGAELLRNVGGRAVVTPLGGSVSGDSISINIYQQPGESAEVLADKVQRVLVRRERQRRAALT